MIIEHRASAVLYRFLVSKNISKKFILPVNICPIVLETFKAAGISVEFFDINNSDYCIDYQSVLDSIKRNPHLYSGILFNHTYGYEKSPIDFFKKLKDLNSHFLIIDDKCLCEPIFTKTLHSDLTMYSTGYAKHVDIGLGGFGCLNNEEEILKFDKVILENGTILECGNFKYNDIVATKIEKLLIKSNIHKSVINEIYDYHFQGICKLHSSLNNWRYNILLPFNSDLILKEIFESGYFASKHYKPLNSNYPNANILYNQVINLFNDKYITKRKAEKLAILIKEKIVEYNINSIELKSSHL